MLKMYVNKTPVVFPLSVLNKISVKRFFSHTGSGAITCAM